MSFQQAMRDLYICQMFAVVGETLLVYNYALTFRMEVAYVWSARWSTVKVLFLFNRYLSLVGQTVYTLQQLGVWHADSYVFCAHFLWFAGLYGFIAGESIRLLVLLRAWAIWGCKRAVAIALIAIYIIYIVANTSIVLRDISKGQVSALAFMYLDETGVCITRGVPKSWTFPVIAFSLDVFAFAMAAYPLGKLYMTTRLGSPFVRFLTLDALLYFFVTVLCGALGIICQTVFVNSPLAAIAEGFGLPILTIFGQCVALNLRQLTSSSRCLHPIVDGARHPSSYNMSTVKAAGGVMIFRTVETASA